MARWPSSSHQDQKERTMLVTFCRVLADRIDQRSMTSRRSSVVTSMSSLSARVGTSRRGSPHSPAWLRASRRTRCAASGYTGRPSSRSARLGTSGPSCACAGSPLAVQRSSRRARRVVQPRSFRILSAETSRRRRPSVDDVCDPGGRWMTATLDPHLGLGERRAVGRRRSVPPGPPGRTDGGRPSSAALKTDA